MRARPGEDFEAAFRASIPRGVYVRRLRTPTAMGFVVPRLVDYVYELAFRLSAEVPDWVIKAKRFRFTPKAGFDLLLTAAAPVPPASFPCGSSVGLKEIPVQPSIFFALELKSVDSVSLPFDNVDPDQEKALSEAATCGHVACLVVEFRRAGEVWVIPIQAWMALRLVAQRKSLPIEDARRIGMEILSDPYRGTSKPYWNVAAWLSGCGAMLPEKAPKAEKSKRKSSVPETPAVAAEPVKSLFDL